MKTTLLALASFLVIGNTYAHEYEAEFKKIATDIKSMVRSDFIEVPEVLSQIDEYRFTLALEFTRIELKRKELKDKFGRVKCALNFPAENLIQVNKDCWEKIRGDKSLAYPLVLHEYLGIMGEEVDNYNISKHMFEFTKKWNEKQAKVDAAARTKAIADEKERKEKQRVIQLEQARLAAIKADSMRQLQIATIKPKVAVMNKTNVAITYQDLISYPTLKEIKSFKMADVLQAFDVKIPTTRTFDDYTARYLCDRMGFNLYVRQIKSIYEYSQSKIEIMPDGLTIKEYEMLSSDHLINSLQCGNK